MLTIITPSHWYSVVWVWPPFYLYTKAVTLLRLYCCIDPLNCFPFIHSTVELAEEVMKSRLDDFERPSCSFTSIVRPLPHPCSPHGRSKQAPNVLRIVFLKQKRRKELKICSKWLVRKILKWRQKPNYHIFVRVMCVKRRFVKRSRKIQLKLVHTNYSQTKPDLTMRRSMPCSSKALYNKLSSRSSIEETAKRKQYLNANHFHDLSIDDIFSTIT